MKKNYILSIIIACSLAVSCNLDYEPVSRYSDITEGVQDGGEFVIFRDRAAVANQLQTINLRYRGQRELYQNDYYLFGDTHSDNAYAGTYGQETTPMANNSVDGSSNNLARSWPRFYTQIAMANNLIWGVDAVSDLSESEKQQYKAQGKIYRAMNYLDLVRIWGDVPLVTTVSPDITAENITELYPLHFPPQADELSVYQLIEQDLLEALPYAPDDTPATKNRVLQYTVLSKSVARALLVRVYAEKPLRNYDKVIQYADELEADGFDLVANYADLFGVILQDPTQPPGPDNPAIESRAKHTVESIYEGAFFPGNTSGSQARMFGRRLDLWNSEFTWAKWITPTRDIIREFLSEEGDKRYEESVVWYECTWTNHYPMDHYPFMYKYRSTYSSFFKMRYAEILLLKAEALIGKGDFAGAAAILNRIRHRAGLGDLPSSATSSKDAIMKAYLRENRLELCFEGQRWYTLVRLDVVEDAMHGYVARDEGAEALVYPFGPWSYRLPIPQTVIDNNSKIVQNPGY